MQNSEIINLTPSALKRFAFIVGKKNVKSIMFLAAVGGGCAGLQYILDVKPHTAELLENGITIYENDQEILTIDRKSVDFIKGTTIDFVENIGGGHFKFNNPNAESACGCGSSFSPKET